ncbi:NAD(P)-dependent oxidoreductase [Kitasatospora sp. NPDC002227]|uniref:NAD-dependent epimerase/dehydratase family protein n=1 Tax=Kitasatospora sp. NPDC002227 TaxID=3154773 RepID=UPI00332F8E13
MRILLTGGTGFIGGETLRLLADPASTTAHPAYSLRVLSRGEMPQPTVGAGVEIEPYRADLLDPDSLRGACTGVDTVLHLASQVGGDAELCHRVNVDGTAALLAEAARAGVRRIVQLSTTAVYRDGVHRDLTEHQAVVEPVSATSRSRMLAERLVLAAGGTVVRPHLVYGAGDTWVLPAVADLLARLPHWIDDGRARISMTAVDDLARPLAALALAPWEPVAGGRTYHACHPEPVRVRELFTLAAEALGRPAPSGSLSLAEATEALGGGSWGRRLSLLGVDHWYRSEELWRITGCPPGPGFAARFAEHAPWYAARYGRKCSDPEVL